MYVTMIIAYSMTSRTEVILLSDDHRYVHLGLGTRLGNSHYNISLVHVDTSFLAVPLASKVRLNVILLHFMRNTP